MTWDSKLRPQRPASFAMRSRRSSGKRIVRAVRPAAGFWREREVACTRAGITIMVPDRFKASKRATRVYANQVSLGESAGLPPANAMTSPRTRPRKNGGVCVTIGVTRRDESRFWRRRGSAHATSPPPVPVGDATEARRAVPSRRPLAVPDLVEGAPVLPLWNRPYRSPRRRR